MAIPSELTNFIELRKAEVQLLRILLLRTLVNKAKKRKGRSPGAPAPPTATVNACWRVAASLLEMAAPGERGVGDYRCAT